MRDLLITTHTPVLRSGRAVRTYGVARALGENRELDLLYVRFGASRPDVHFQAIPRIAFHEVVPSRGARRAVAYARARFAGVPAAFARGVSPELTHGATCLAAAPGRGRVIADGPIAAAAVRELAQKTAVIYNAHNFESGFRHDLAERGSTGWHGLRPFERDLLERASESWMVSEADMRAARQLCPSARLRLAPNVVDVAAIEPVTDLSLSPRAIFVADFSYEPNRRGLSFLIEEVFPRVWRELPDARLALVGPGLERPPSDDPRVETLGFVEELADVYTSARCAVVPLLQGGGSPLKLVEALAYGLPTIATPRAVAGLDGAKGGEHLLVAEDAEAFAAAVVDVLRDGSSQIGRAGRKLVQERYSIEALSALLRPDSRQ